MEKVVLFFLAKQGELASRLLDARREINDCKTGETYICFGATAKEMEEEWVSDSPISRYGDSPDQEPTVRLLIYRGGNRRINALPPAKR